jgi:hypothetical protein
MRQGAPLAGQSATHSGGPLEPFELLKKYFN